MVGRAFGFQKLVKKKKSKIDFRVSMVVTNKNVDEIPKTRRFWARHGVRLVTSALENRGGNIADAEQLNVGEMRSMGNCVRPSRDMMILFNGDVPLCCVDWHRTYVLDATLWSPPHLLSDLAMSSIDVSLLLGFTAAARRLGWGLDWRRPAFWGIVLAGAFNFEAANFLASQAFVEGFRAGGTGLWGLLFPLLMGAWYPLLLVTLVRATGRFWVVLPVALLCLGMQYIATGLAALGFAILQPVSVMEEFVRANPTAVVSLAREFGRLNGFSELIGLQQAWVMWFSVAPLALVALLDLRPALRARPWLAAPVYSASLVLICYALFQRLPLMAAYAVNAGHVLLALVLAVAGGLVTAWLGQKLGRLADKM